MANNEKGNEEIDMNILNMVTSGLIDSVGSAIDKIFTNDEERLAMKNKLVSIKADAELKAVELENQYQKEISSRWISDNKAGWLTRNVRPMTLVFLLVVLTSMAFTSGNIGSFKIDDSFVDLFQILSITAFGAYFGSRGLEKIKGK